MDVTAPIRPNDLFSAKGLVVVITGGGSGLGLAIASTFYQNGAAKIYILGRRHDVLLNAVEKLQSSVPSDAQNPTSVKEIVCDVTSLSSIQAAASFIEKETGYIDVLINNAGVLGPKNSKEIYAATNIHELSASMLLGWDTWSAALAINTQSVIGVSATFLPLLEAANTRRGWAPGKVPATTGTPRARDTSQLSAHDITPDDDRMAHIITIASVASFNRWISAGLAYSATKCAAMHLGKMMSTFLAEWGVRSECKSIMLNYLRCIKSHRGSNDPECRDLSKSYLACRMDRNLMAPDSFKNLGFGEDADGRGPAIATSSQPSQPRQGHDKPDGA
ncbi:FabG Dehydrogenase with different specificities related to short-chain alcohol dehydrogenase [Pyrenophora tritici-repentis]|uniref:Short chain dehydrogenase n=1 Tax=Pyrenophora tritici-repentis TaxID=45151 RepID=A0A2W1DPQ5_9PLEO|nr:FabG Dehydrogenase [Pyrenophora tritici-repentis]KAI1519717.1 short chain dehydrogenase [Pyrenophora tritici-repentis]KAI1534136.1 FabG Dehydrogenase with different specificities related to short-chain alcohol dehydrogenase [Pyrenophora tritici-repentis]KAI1549926.1 FabG Dehydrogenase with different specificities related to short-chain alcohol dehydrogenase [Pyrenophora tritici-repentis]KAI1686929.1 short chain dehydrogenase [Pyrenophora tritici-repentis]